MQVFGWVVKQFELKEKKEENMGRFVLSCLETLSFLFICNKDFFKSELPVCPLNSAHDFN